MGRHSQPNLSKNEGLVPCGFLINSLGTSQEGFFLTHELNSLLKTYPNMDISVFYETFDRIPTMPYFPMYPMVNLWGYEGMVIATDVDGIYRTFDIPSIKKRFLYVTDLEWTYNAQLYSYYNNAYNNEQVELIARSLEHAAILESCWKAPTYVIEDFKAEEIHSLVIQESVSLRYA